MAENLHRILNGPPAQTILNSSRATEERKKWVYFTVEEHAEQVKVMVPTGIEIGSNISFQGTLSVLRQPVQVEYDPATRKGSIKLISRQA